MEGTEAAFVAVGEEHHEGAEEAQEVRLVIAYSLLETLLMFARRLRRSWWSRRSSGRAWSA